MQAEDVLVRCYYLNQELKPFAISAAQVLFCPGSEFK